MPHEKNGIGEMTLMLSIFSLLFWNKKRGDSAQKYTPEEAADNAAYYEMRGDLNIGFSPRKPPSIWTTMRLRLPKI